MDELIFSMLRLVVVMAVLIVARYLVPWIKAKIGETEISRIEKLVNDAVLMAQQVHWDKTGPERKAIVIEYLEKMLTAKNISITDEQINMLIEAAVKTMKMEEGNGVHITVNNSTVAGSEEVYGEEVDFENDEDFLPDEK